MATAYTPILKLALPVTGELNGTWGDVVNQNITEMVEQAVAGLATINTWTTNSHTLTTANGTTSESRCAMLVADDDGVGNPSAAATIICPASSKLYILKNISGQTVTLKTAAGTGIAVPNNQTSFLFCDGTNVESCVTSIVDGNVSGNLTVQGNATVNGNTTLGNATSDTVTLTARVASVVAPSADNTYDLGSVANSWKDLYIDGTAYLALVDINGGTIDGTTIGGTTPAAGSFTSLSASSTVSGTGFSNYLASPPAIGGSTPAAGSFTNLAYTGTLTGGTGVINIGSGQVYKDASGNVGIGTVSPLQKLDVDGNIQVRSTNRIGFFDQSYFIRASTGLEIQSADTVRFLTGGSNERMRIDSAGNVGIGTSSPGQKLSINSASTSVNSLVEFRQGDVIQGYAGFGSDNALRIQSVGTQPVGMSTVGAGYLFFTTQNTERMRIDSSGNLGLGVTPSAWTLPAIESTYGLFTGRLGATISHNAYNDGSWKYSSTNFASRYLQQNGAHTWFTAPSGTAGNAISFTQAMTLDSGGRLGLGITSPSTTSKITILDNTYASYRCENGAGGYALYGLTNTASSEGFIDATNALQFRISGTEIARVSGDGGFGVNVTSVSGFGGKLVSAASSTSQSGLVSVSSSSAAGNLAKITWYHPGNDAFTIAGGTTLQFLASGTTERMRIDASGNLLVGTTTNNTTSKLRVASSAQGVDISVANNGANYITNTSGTASYNAFVFANNGQTYSTCGTIAVSGSSTAYNTGSDYRLKENVQPMTGALNKVAQLKPCTFTWKSTGEADEGFIAHELQAVCPSAVTGEKDAVDADGKPKYQGVDTSFLVATLVAAIQELKAEVDALKAAA